MIDIEFTSVRILPVIDTPFRVLALFVTAVLVIIIVINSS